MGRSFRCGRGLARMTGVGAALTAALLTTAGSAAAKTPPPLTCASVLTTSVTLRANLTCPENGLVVGANGITVNLAGHTIAGTGSASAISRA